MQSRSRSKYSRGSDRVCRAAPFRSKAAPQHVERCGQTSGSANGLGPEGVHGKNSGRRLGVSSRQGIPSNRGRSSLARKSRSDALRDPRLVLDASRGIRSDIFLSLL